MGGYANVPLSFQPLASNPEFARKTALRPKGGVAVRITEERPRDPLGLLALSHSCAFPELYFPVAVPEQVRRQVAAFRNRFVGC